MTRKAAILSSVLMLLPMAAAAQDGPQTQWDEWVQSTALTPQVEVYVTLVTGQRIRGWISDATSTALTVTDGRNVQEYGGADNARIERRDPIVSGALIGLGVGYLVDLPIAATDGGEYILMWTLLPPPILGAAIGGIVDSNHNEMLYEAGSAQVSVTPTLDIGNRGVGVRMSVGW